MSDQLYSTNEPLAEEIHELLEIGMLTRVEIDYEAAADVLEGRMIGLRSRTGAMKAAQRSVNAALGIIEGGDE